MNKLSAFSVLTKQRMNVRKRNLVGLAKMVLSGSNIRRAEFLDLSTVAHVCVIDKWPNAFDHPSESMEIRRATVPPHIDTFGWVYHITRLSLSQCTLPSRIMVPANITRLAIDGVCCTEDLVIETLGPSAGNLQIEIKNCRFEHTSNLDICGNIDIFPARVNIVNTVLCRLFIKAAKVELEKCSHGMTLNLQDFWATEEVAIVSPRDLTKITDVVARDNVHGPVLPLLKVMKSPDNVIELEDLPATLKVYILAMPQTE